MTSHRFQWFILAGGLSPYTLDLWEAVADRSSHEVILAYTPRKKQQDHTHEAEIVQSKKLELIPIHSWLATTTLGRRCWASPSAGIVCMGYSPVYNLLISALLKLRKANNPLVFYMSDTNGIALAEHVGGSNLAALGLLGKRAVLSSVFENSFDLGFSNSIAHRMQGIRHGFNIPLLATTYPASMTAALPEPLAALIRDLPRPRLLTLSRLVKCKNLDTLIGAFTGAIHRGMPGSLVIVGEGPERSRLEALIPQALGRATLAGSVSFRESRQIFGAFDGLVLPSTADAWGIVIIEALGWGLPVLSSLNCGAGLSLAIESSGAIGLCKTSREEMESSLFDFVSNLDSHTRAAKLLAPQVRSRFSTERVADMLIALAKDRSKLRG